MLKYLIAICFCAISISFISQTSLNFSHESGKYTNSFVLKINGNYNKIYYTLDGSIPDRYSKKWTDSLLISKTSILRFKPLFNDAHLDTVINKFYLLGFNKELPVLHLSINHQDLWSAEKGIYVKGNSAYLDSTGDLVNTNLYKDWEKLVHLMYFDADSLSIQQDCGLKLFGESTRKYRDKSFKLIARSEYGSNVFPYQLFPLKKLDKHKHLVIRTSGNDFNGTRFKDVLSAYLVRNLEIDHMAFQPIHLFINDDYWGLYNLREKINEHYIKYNKGFDKDSVSIIMGKWVRQQGSSKDYMKMYNWFFKLKDMDSVAYIQANQFLDIKNYINFRIFQLYINNSDSRGNIRYWNSSQGDGRFRMILYDTDHGYKYAKRKLLQHSLSNAEEYWYNPRWSTRYLRKLMVNDEFKNEFLVQYAHFLNTSLHTDTIIASVDYLQDVYVNELPRPGDDIVTHLKRLPKTEEEWLIEVEKLRTFARIRNDFVKSELVRLLAPEGWFELEINNINGRVSVNDNYPVCLPFKGNYLKGYEFKVEALDEGCHQFISWSDGDSNRIKLVSADTTFQFYPIYECVIPLAIESEIKVLPGSNDTRYLGLKLNELLMWLGCFLLAFGFALLLYIFLKRTKAR